MYIIKSKIKYLLIGINALLFLSIVNGCKDDSVQPNNNVDFSYVSSPEMTAASTGSVLEIDVVKVLLKDIKLNVASGNEVNFKTGPFVLYLDFNTNLTMMSTAYITPGTYDRVKFEIHKLNDNETPPDPDFADANGRYSTVVKGKFNGVNFTFKSSMSAHQILAFQKSLVVTAEGKSNITLMAKPYLWFMVNGEFVDPSIETNKPIIELNIINNVNQNIKVFVDNDRNGQPD